ncbi:MAG: LemA family protein [Leptospirales bacterium]|nr:LemA family protein [Leptospirales bacterium]
MGTIGIIAIAGIVVVVLLVLMIIGFYNSVVKLRNNRENAFADIDVQLRQRHDLIPQLVETVRGYAKHESETLQAVVEARNGAMRANTIDEKIAAENVLSSALQGLKVTVERYPDLKANQNFLQLQEEVSDVENKIAASRRFFNSTTKEFNTRIQTFPANIFAGIFGFHKEAFFDLGAERETVSEVPKIQF